MLLLPTSRSRGEAAQGLDVGVSCWVESSSIMSAPASLQRAFEKYELCEEIGHGGMATVYRARDLRLGREVALKVIHRHLRENHEVASRFASEALAVAKLKHPNIVEVYDVSDEDDEERYLVVELVRGITLRRLLTDRRQLPAEIAAAIGLEVCAGLAHAHRQGVIHRDIKPENVLIELDPTKPEGADGDEDEERARIKLADFGIAKLLDAQGVTSTGQVLGSPAHMAPEQIEGGDVDCRADVFGVGVLLYECMVGQLPFDGKNPAQVLRRVLEGTFTAPDRARPIVGSQWSAIVSKALAQQPSERFADTTELAAALKQELATLGFDEPRSELARYLADPERYLESYGERILESLSGAGHAAREEGDVLRAAGFFNRALAFKPDDTQLLAEVAGLARRARRRRRIVRLGSGALLAAGLAGAALWVGSKLMDSAETAAAEAERAGDGAPRDVATTTVTEARVSPAASSGEPPPVPSTASALPEPSAPSAKAPAAPPPRKPEISRRKAQNRPAPPETSEMRDVRTLVIGPQNAKVRIDGKLEPWFRTRQLTLGPHTFEFVPPNNECCEPTAPRTIEIVPGEGAQVVQGTIPFKPAVLRYSGPPGSRASCGMAGQLAVGETKEIPLNRPAHYLTCTIFPSAESAEEPKRIDVTLQPGRTFVLTGS